MPQTGSRTPLAAGLAALVAAALMYWLSAALNPPAVIQTTDDLAGLLALPLVGTAEVTGRSTVRRWHARPWLARACLHGCELRGTGFGKLEREGLTSLKFAQNVGLRRLALLRRSRHYRNGASTSETREYFQFDESFVLLVAHNCRSLHSTA